VLSPLPPQDRICEAQTQQPRIHLDKVSKTFGSLRVVDNLSLDVAAGEFVSLLGPSGSGKTTLLMMLAGFETPSAGEIWLDGRRIDQVPPHRRGLGVVFQNYALFPHLSVAANVAFPLEMRSVGKAEIAEKVHRVLDMVQLTTMADRKPSQLSGGQQQRVALARALVFEPSVVLMDEPLGALDKKLREQMQLDIRALHRRLGLTILFVTHDQSEALTMSNRIAVFNHGRIEQIATPREIYDRPATRFVAEFIGETNLIEGIVEQADALQAVVRSPLGKTVEVQASRLFEPGQKVLVSVRPERMVLNELPTLGRNSFPTRIVDTVYQGDHLRLLLEHDSLLLTVRIDRRTDEWQVGDSVVVSFATSDGWIIPA
jgi:putative spermidine/putrescine transport system ATP-binding protein